MTKLDWRSCSTKLHW